MREREDLLAAGSPEGLRRQAGLVLWAVSGVLVLGTVVDLGVLWLAQHQSNPQWEFVALVRTLDAFPRLALGFALAYVARLLCRSRSKLGHRVLGVLVLLLGLVGAALGVLLLTDYFVLARVVEGANAQLALRSTVVKGLMLSGLYLVLLTPIGALVLRRPRN